MAKRSQGKSKSYRALWIVGGVVALVIVCAVAPIIYVSLRLTRDVTETDIRRPGTLVVASSPEKEPLFRELVDRFNRAGYRTSDGTPMRLSASYIDMETLINAAVEGEVDAISPDSSVWLGDIDARWREAAGDDTTLAGRAFRYAVSPVVIAAWEDVAHSLGWPGPVGWQTLLSKAQADPNFKWSHPAASTASGLLATLAEFYAGAGKTRGLTTEDVQAQSTLDYVAALEKTVRYYGEGELAVIQRAREEGPGFLDAFVVQEQMVIQFNQDPRGNPRLVAIYPQEGTLWEDHPMVLLEHPNLRAPQRETFERWRQFLLSEETQRLVLQHGYRPADLNIPLEAPVSPENGADPGQPQTTLQIPGGDVVEVVTPPAAWRVRNWRTPRRR